MAIAVCQSNTQKVYALIESDSDQEKGGLFVSNNAGKSWSRISADHQLVQRAWYYIEVFADPIGEWSAFALREIDLRSVSEFRIVEGSNGDQAPPPVVRVRGRTDSPRVHLDPVAGTTSTKGWPVVAACPQLELPSAFQTDRWQFTLRVDGVQHIFSGSDAEANEGRFEHLLPQSGLAEVELLARGPLGSDLRIGFIVAPGLSILRSSD